MRLTKIYTRQGDDGCTTLGKQRISKDDLLIEAIGTIDELNACIGVILSFPIQNKEMKQTLTQIQNNLFDMGGELYLPKHPVIAKSHVTYLEQRIDDWNTILPPLEEFVLPRGNPTSAASHVARTVCRRAERCLVRLHKKQPLANLELLRYLNRLSDLLFVAARMLARETDEKELLWDHKKK
jgi:cob(I)alamin adenosyltransferase